MLLPQVITLFHFNLCMDRYKINFILFCLGRNLNLQVRHNKNKNLTTFKLTTLYKWHWLVCGSAVSVALTSGTPYCRGYILLFVSMAHHVFSRYLLYKIFLSIWMCSFLAGRKPLTFSFFFLLLIQGSQWQSKDFRFPRPGVMASNLRGGVEQSRLCTDETVWPNISWLKLKHLGLQMTALGQTPLT